MKYVLRIARWAGILARILVNMVKFIFFTIHTFTCAILFYAPAHIVGQIVGWIAMGFREGYRRQRKDWDV